MRIKRVSRAKLGLEMQTGDFIIWRQFRCTVIMNEGMADLLVESGKTGQFQHRYTGMVNMENGCRICLEKKV